MATILIVDDDAAMREGLAETLTDLGHVPRTASSGREALTALSADIDGVLLDLRMPGGMDGIEVLRRIRPLSREHKMAFLRSLISLEKKRSWRRAELEAVLKAIVNQELKFEVRQAKKERAA